MFEVVANHEQCLKRSGRKRHCRSGYFVNRTNWFSCIDFKCSYLSPSRFLRVFDGACNIAFAGSSKSSFRNFRRSFVYWKNIAFLLAWSTSTCARCSLIWCVLIVWFSLRATNEVSMREYVERALRTTYT